MKSFFTFFFLLVVSACLFAQQSRINLSEKSICSINGRVSLSTINVGHANNKVELLLEKINKYSGFPMNYLIQSTSNTSVGAISAVEENGDNRLIIYNDVYLAKITEGEGRYQEWTLIFVLAHEVGHQIAGHTLKENENRAGEELTADYFAGYILGRFGAEQSEVMQAIDFLEAKPEDGVHPPKVERVKSVLAGWESAKEKKPSPIIDPRCIETTSSILIINNSDKDKQIKQIILDDGVILQKYRDVIIPKNSSLKLTNIKVGTQTLQYYNSFYNQGNIWHDMATNSTTFTVHGCNENNQLILK